MDRNKIKMLIAIIVLTAFALSLVQSAYGMSKVSQQTGKIASQLKNISVKPSRLNTPRPDAANRVKKVRTPKVIPTKTLVLGAPSAQSVKTFKPLEPTLGQQLKSKKFTIAESRSIPKLLATSLLSMSDQIRLKMAPTSQDAEIKEKAAQIQNAEIQIPTDKTEVLSKKLPK